MPLTNTRRCSPRVYKASDAGTVHSTLVALVQVAGAQGTSHVPLETEMPKRPSPGPEPKELPVRVRVLATPAGTLVAEIALTSGGVQLRGWVT